MKQDCIFLLHPAGFASCKSTLFFHLLSWWIWMGVGYEFNSQFPFETCVQGIIVAVLTKTKYRPQWLIQPPWVATGASHRWKWGFSICLLSFSLHWEDNDTRWDQTLNNVLNHISKCLDFVKTAPLHVFPPLFSVFGNVVKHSWLVSTCLIRYKCLNWSSIAFYKPG